MGEVVLVHGAWHGPWCWDGVRAELLARGIESAAVELPLTGLRDDVAAARTVIESAGEGAVVCGHSYGGIVISHAASGLSNVTWLIYMAAYMLDDDTTVMRDPVRSPVLSALRRTEAGVIVDPDRLREVLYADSTPAVVTDIARLLRPMPLTGGGGEIEGEPAWKSIPSTYVITLRDNAISPSAQRVMAAQATRVIEWDTDHSPFLTRPAEVAALLAGVIDRPEPET
jgi:pimeloyl-ACP methyl ester carboxylesterase